MLYDVIDHETGEIYLSTATAPEVSKFLVHYECSLMPAPDFLDAKNRSENDFYVLPQIEVTD